jgi:stromal membrane-associated protein
MDTCWLCAVFAAARTTHFWPDIPEHSKPLNLPRRRPPLKDLPSVTRSRKVISASDLTSTVSMSRRPGNDRAAQNAQTLKALVKLEGNKVCADCKRNKHPRWASWNLGVFVCIRCSGIHRGMGTHISRVKSVDLDAWTDEQLQSVLKWGNTRANKYWEAKLAPGHVPSEAKIENFIRTKYESKRWVMDGPMPDPSTLDADGDDNVPLSIVQEKAKIERSTSQRQAAAQPAPAPRPAQNVNLFDDFAPTPPVRPSTADIPASKPTRTGPPSAAPAPKAATKPQDSLLGLDFFGGPSTSNAGRPSSAAANPTAASNPRGDLKNSILSLYSSAPKPQPAPQPQHDRQPSFGGMTATPAAKSDAFGGLADAFGGLSFPSSTTAVAKPPMPQQSSAFSAFGSLTSPVAAPKAAPSAPQVTSPPPLSGGSFFDSLPARAPAAKPAVTSPPASNGLDFSFTQRAPAPQLGTAPQPKPSATSIPVDLFAADDFGGFASSTPVSPPKPAPAPQVASPSLPSTNFNSPFNLSSQPPASQPAAPAPTSQAARPAMPPPSNSSTFDPWASGNDGSPWGAPESAPAKPAQPKVELGKVPSRITPNDISGGWGEPISSSNKPVRQASVTADEDFGGWTSASTTQTPVAPPSNKPGGGFGGGPDPFDNPWG